MDDSGPIGSPSERDCATGFLTQVFVIWIVWGLPQKRREWLHQKVAEKRATPVVRERRVSRSWWYLKYTSPYRSRRSRAKSSPTVPLTSSLPPRRQDRPNASEFSMR